MARDYILRIIEQLGMVIAGILDARRRGDTPTALAEVQQKCLQHVGLPFDSVKHAAPESLAELLRTGGALEHIRAITLAELLIQEAEIQLECGNHLGALVGQLQAFCLLRDHVGAFGPTEQPALVEKLDGVRAQLVWRERELGPGVASALPERFANILADPLRAEPLAAPGA